MMFDDGELMLDEIHLRQSFAVAHLAVLVPSPIVNLNGCCAAICRIRFGLSQE